MSAMRAALRGSSFDSLRFRESEASVNSLSRCRRGISRLAQVQTARSSSSDERLTSEE
jgi:hypothetical protein